MDLVPEDKEAINGIFRHSTLNEAYKYILVPRYKGFLHMKDIVNYPNAWDIVKAGVDVITLYSSHGHPNKEK
ncbi:hypothetical protein [Candidatus Walczuchella monophlebidarum]|uniref:hypothetical protein n=1 Tax=Candidatus Walczuchella monophlebidarum TaxID=1415657 RepID=UPI00056F53E4|nr:hypothetical protein [Candidatus Walczuchella monophlebidarum]